MNEYYESIMTMMTLQPCKRMNAVLIFLNYFFFIFF